MRPHAVLLCLVTLAAPLAAAETPAEVLSRAAAALKDGRRDRALEIVNQGVADHPGEAGLVEFRGSVYEGSGKFAEAVADYTKALDLDPRRADVLNRRGGAHFKLGQFAESVADFDRYVEKQPAAGQGHWQRGISLYYAGKYAEGKKQFEGYEKVDTNDVENAVWHFLCAARADGVEKARAGLLKIGKDRRTPMTEVYALFKGDLKPADVLAAAAGDDLKGEQRRHALFYAHLYLGLYYDVTGDKDKALAHLTEAAGKYRIAHYMGDVARVHEALLRKAVKPE